MILSIAKEYSQAPQDVEQWDEYWLNRAWLKMRGESIHRRREAQPLKRKLGRR